jgi:hypothetical protein
MTAALDAFVRLREATFSAAASQWRACQQRDVPSWDAPQSDEELDHHDADADHTNHYPNALQSTRLLGRACA